MAKKVYKSVTGDVITFPVIVSGAKVWVDCNPDYETTVSEVQTAIEAHSYFTSGNIMTSGNITEQVKELSDKDVVSGNILKSEITTAGTDYVVGDVIELSSTTGNKAVIRVLTITEETGAVETYEVLDGGTEYEADDVLTVAATTSTAGADFTMTVLTTTGETEFKGKDPFKLTIFDEVTTINQAKDTLRNEPYNINHQKLRTPEAIMAQAIEHSVSFPNWVI